MDWINTSLGISPDTQGKLLASFLVIAALFIGRWLILRALPKRSDDMWSAYRASKVITYTATVVGLLSLAWIWIDAFDNLPTFLGLLSAGIAIALSDVLKNLAGWFYILSRRPFRLGDRIEVDGAKGDVIDVRLFRFSLMEIGNWVDADQSTGRLIHIPNGLLFTKTVANYTEGFEYIWYEIPVLITFESDRAEARQLIERAVSENTPNVEMAAGSRIRETARDYHIKVGTLTPIVYLSVDDSGVMYTCRFLVGARQQRDIAQAVWEAILDGIDQANRVELAYPTVRTYLRGPVTVTGESAAPTETVPRQGGF